MACQVNIEYFFCDESVNPKTCLSLSLSQTRVSQLRRRLCGAVDAT
jgi:hypothetical protein